MPHTYAVQGRYFEEFALGETAVTPERTITEADNVNFAGVSGDFTQVHTSEEFARRTPFGRRIAHGLLGLAVVSGLMGRLGLLEKTVMAFRDMTWKYSLPIYIGDTVHAEATVAALKALPRLQAGALTFDIRLLNQDAKTVQSGLWTLLVACRPA